MNRALRTREKAAAAVMLLGISSLIGIVVGVVVMFVLHTLVPAVLGAQTLPRPHKDSHAAAVAIVERNLRASGTTPDTTRMHFVNETQMGTGPVMRMEVYLDPPVKVRVTTTVGGQPVLDFGFDGTTGWTDSPMTGLVRLSGAELEAMRASLSFGSPVKVDSTMRLMASGRQTFDGQSVDGVRMIQSTGDTAELFYAVSTGFLVGTRSIVPKPGMPPGGSARDTMTMSFRDHKRINGGMQPMTIMARVGGIESVTRTTHMDHDPIPAERFRPPAALREVPPTLERTLP